jgi:hypothetical protein
VAHVVGAVAEVDHGEAGEVALVLADGEPVGQDLARVEVVGECVDHRHTGVRGHLLEIGLAERAPGDGRRHPSEHASGVGH